MTRNDIIKLAKEYGFTGGFDAQGNLTFDATFVDAVTDAVATTRNACAPWLAVMFCAGVFTGVFMACVVVMR